jgi:cytochrome c oxidase subunit 1
MSAPLPFWRRYVFSTDHKVIGIQYIATGFAMAIVGGLLAMLIRLQLGWPGKAWPWLEKLFPQGMLGGIMAPEFYLSLVTMHGTIMVFFFISYVLVSGFGNYLVPLQIGANDMAFPFLNMLSYWIGLGAAIVALASFWAEGGAAAAGWTAYPPLSAVASAVPGSHLGQTLWLLSMALFIASFTMSGLNIIATVLCLRAPGMSFWRLPLTTWSYLVSAVIGVLAFPPLTAAAVMLLLDRHLGTSFFLPSGLVVAGEHLPNQGGTPLLWQHLFWFLGHPEVYVLILPALGIVFDVLAPFTRKPVFGYRITTVCYLAIAGLSLIVWGHHMFVSGMSPFSGEYFSLVTLLITIPSAIIGVNMLGSVFGGALRLTTPSYFALGLIAFFGVGGFGGLFLGNATADIQLHDTYFVVGHFHFMIGGVTLLATFAAVYFWFPKMFGRRLGETLGKLHFWFTLVPFYTIFLSQHFIGLAGMPRRYYAFVDYEFLKPVAHWNVLISTAAFVLGAGQLLFLGNVVWTLARRRSAEANPWQAATLEWSTESPPPHGNWVRAPQVHRWAYEYAGSAPAGEDFVPQHAPPSPARPAEPPAGDLLRHTVRSGG